MQVRLNGELKEIKEGLSIEELLNVLGFHARAVVVELNRSIVRFPQFGSTALKSGDEVEVVRIVGGGSFAE
ncbi:MAG: sulfur carrier protein ThiS [Candidatus Omnitrophica bacterium]|nr:sulfur carrier protein ThiS [Candidatus Omnitrophota bacterium]